MNTGARRMAAPTRPAKLGVVGRIGRLVGCTGETAWLGLLGVVCGIVLWLLVGPPPNPSTVSRTLHQAALHGAILDAGTGARSGAHHPAAEAVHVAITATMSHAVGVLAVINSTLQNAANPDAVHFHLITPRKDGTALARLVQGPGGAGSPTVLFSQQPAALQIHVDETATHAAVHNAASASRTADLSQNIVYARYYLAATFPTLDRIIYFDADLIVLGDVAELWRADLQGKPLGAVTRCKAKMERNFDFDAPNVKKYLKRYNRKACTFNNGVMLYDLVAWRKNRYHKQLVVWTELNAKKALYNLGSQPPFNLVFYENYHALDPSWNVMDAGDPTLYPNRQEVAEAKVLHWNGEEKPWFVSPHRVLLSGMFTKSLPFWESAVVMEKFTVVIVTQGLRLRQLETVLTLLGKCRFVHEVLLVWNNAEEECRFRSSSSNEKGHRVRCLPQAANDMQNRLLVADSVETEAVFHHDDDVVFDLESIELGFKVWRRNRNAVVGYQPRVHLQQQKGGVRQQQQQLEHPGGAAGGGAWRYEFHLSEGYYTFVIGKAFFVSRTLMEAYAATDALVRLNRGLACEDLAINLFAAQQAGSAGCIVVESNHRELSSAAEAGDGLSTRISSEKWSEARQACLSQLAGYFTDDFMQQMPKSTRIAVGYDYVHNEIAYRDVVPLESICSDTHGVKRCRVPSCKASNNRLPCYKQ